MGCDWVRQALSAELDGEADPSEAAAATSHVARCLSCRAWLTGARRVDRSVRGLRLSMPVPDQTAAVLARLESEPRAKAGAPGVLAVRLGLVAVAGANLTMAACLLFGVHIGVLEPVAEHAGRELAAFQAALAAAFLASAWDGRARGRLAMVATAMVLLVATALADLSHGETHLEYELAHLPEVAGFALLALLRRSEGPAGSLRPLRLRRPKRGHLRAAA